jgi:hypothetical protein
VVSLLVIESQVLADRCAQMALTEKDELAEALATCVELAEQVTRGEPESKSKAWLMQTSPLIEELGFSLLRVFAVDVTQCPRCGSALRILSAIMQPDVIERILHHLDLPTAPPSCSRAPPAQVDLSWDGSCM